MEILIKNGKVWYKEQWLNRDILIQNNTITQVAENIEAGNVILIDAQGHIVVPGLIDMHVHLREPGFEQKETIETGAIAAAKGGFATIAAMPNTNPVIDTAKGIIEVNEKGKEVRGARVIQIGAITKGQQGEELTDFSEMKEAGGIGFSDDGKGVQSTRMMKNAMEKAKEVGLPIIAHCEDMDLVEGGAIHAGLMAERLNIPGISSASEYIQIARDIEIAELTGAQYHVCHISTKRSVELIKEAKGRGVKVTTEVTPHHLLLTEEELQEPLALFKMNPPLRSKTDRQALINGLLDGTIDIIATDHAPHTEMEKQQDILSAPFGVVGLETAFPLLYTHLVQKNIMTLEQLVNLLTIKPATIFKLNGGEIKEGKQADITIIDLTNEKMVNVNEFLSKGKNTPFNGWKLKGWPILTIVGGEIQWENEEVQLKYV